jgi:hypothetical protein
MAKFACEGFVTMNLVHRPPLDQFFKKLRHFARACFGDFVPGCADLGEL